MRPVGEVEHRENLLDFVSWATGGSTGERTGVSTGEGSKDADDPKSGQAKDASTMKSNQSGEEENSGETGTKEEKQVCALIEIVSNCFCKTGENQFDDHYQVYVPDWIANPDEDLRVVFSSRAEQDLNNIDLRPCNWLRSTQELRWT